MTVLPFKRTELGRWRKAINDASLRLNFNLLRSPGQTQLAVTASQAGDDEPEEIALRALIETDATLGMSITGDISEPTAAILIAIVFRDRLLDLMTTATGPIPSRYASVSPATARQAYREALANVLNEVLDQIGVEGVRGLKGGQSDP